jgi:phosphoribosylformylglycinamidine synthase
MSGPQVLVLRAPGTNCEAETALAFEMAGASARQVHIQAWMDEPSLADPFHILCVPGGFSYGDDLAAGRLLATQLTNRLSDSLQRFRDRGHLILGICNGFQVLLKAGLILPPEQGRLSATLTWNDVGRYQDRWVWLRVLNPQCVFLKGIDRMFLPVAHAEGKIVAKDEETLTKLQARGLAALQYTDAHGAPASGLFPDNPNGSHDDLAGLCDESGRVFGLMPHPERHVVRTHHPYWTRLSDHGEPDGLRVFRNAVEYFF